MQGSSKKQKSDLLKLAVTLCLIAGITAALVALVNAVTAPEIARRNENKTAQSLKAVMADADSFEVYDYTGGSVTSADGKEIVIDGVWRAKRGKEYIGFCVKVSPKGYGGAIETIVGISADGTVTDTKIVSMSETSGIGTKIETDDFLTQFKGKSTNIGGVKSSPSKNEIQTISGATKSSKAFLRGVNAALAVVSQINGGEN